MARLVSGIYFSRLRELYYRSFACFVVQPCEGFNHLSSDSTTPDIYPALALASGGFFESAWVSLFLFVRSPGCLLRRVGSIRVEIDQVLDLGSEGRGKPLLS